MKQLPAAQAEHSIVFARKHSTAESTKSFTTRHWVMAMNIFMSCVLCWSYYTLKIQSRTNVDVDDETLSVSIDSSQSKLLGLVLDAGRGLLYYTDMLRGIIGEMTVSGTNQRVIFSDGSKRPRAIVVDSDNRWTKSLIYIIACKTLQVYFQSSLFTTMWPSVNMAHFSTLDSV